MHMDAAGACMKKDDHNEGKDEYKDLPWKKRFVPC